MKRIIFISLVAVLLMTGTVRADLVVQDYLGLGEKVTLDTATGNHWVRDLSIFTNMTYAEQISAIADLNIAPPYGNIEGGWHMATRAEMETLWSYDVATMVAGAFEISDVIVVGGVTYDVWLGRYEQSIPYPGPPAHFYGLIEEVPGGYERNELYEVWSYDTVTHHAQGAWVVSDQSVVPLPGALILAATGLLSSMLGLNRLRRKR